MIRGMAWDHPRARDPLEAISAQWSAESGIPVTWDARSLKDFEDQPLDELASRYDIVLMDYPFTGTAATSGLIAPVEGWADTAYLHDQREHTVGPSYDSYTWAGQQWALAIDAATQVSAWRPDLAADAGLERPPQTWSAVAELAAQLAGAPARVAMPLNPNHAYCAFLSVGLATAGPAFWRHGKHVQREPALAALAFLKALAPNLHPWSREADPIAMSDRMAGTGEIVFVPLMFGYLNYARAGFRPHVLRFGNAPRGEGGHIGSVLGGVGIALSTHSAQTGPAADLARLLASGPVQAGPYLASGGQPGHAAAWDSESANAMVGGFFRDTRETMEQAFLRPRVSGHRQFQEEAGRLIHEFLWQDKMNAETCLAKFESLVNRLLGRWEAQDP